MLSYRHAFHAGNHADVLKHAVLALSLDYLKHKEKPFCYLDTHAGAGVYDLRGAYSSKGAEYHGGIGRLWRHRDKFPQLACYLNAVAALNPDGELRYYPGSPMVARQLMRSQDRLQLVELHNTDVNLLRGNFRGDGQVAVHHRNGFEALVALCPPTPRRGLVLIDPPYEVKQDYQTVVETVGRAVKRWPQGAFAIWYPILGKAIDRSGPLLKGIARLGEAKVLQIELRVAAAQADRGMHGSGMVIVNPPWQLDESVGAMLPGIADLLAVDEGAGYTLAWIGA